MQNPYFKFEQSVCENRWIMMPLVHTPHEMCIESLWLYMFYYDGLNAAAILCLADPSKIFKSFNFPETALFFMVILDDCNIVFSYKCNVWRKWLPSWYRVFVARWTHKGSNEPMKFIPKSEFRWWRIFHIMFHVIKESNSIP